MILNPGVVDILPDMLVIFLVVIKNIVQHNATLLLLVFPVIKSICGSEKLVEEGTVLSEAVPIRGERDNPVPSLPLKRMSEHQTRY